jgi:hypothetical protein
MLIRGVIEGFYGRPWTWEERLEVCRWVAARGLTDYVYAPKDDPKHRAEWRVPYETDELAGFAGLAEVSDTRLGFAISPGLSIDAGDAEDRRALATKVDQVVGVGATLVVLALDDIPFGGGPQGRSHAELTTWLRAHLDDRAGLVLVPTEYVGVRHTPYLEALAGGVPDDVPIGWTGTSVVPSTITAAEARARAEALGGRSPLLWDNASANDATMTDRLPIGPLRGREPALADELAGYLANPLTQPHAARIHLASVAAWLDGQDPVTAWRAAAGELETGVLAEACDGEVPRALVALALRAPDDDTWRAASADLRDWLSSAAACEVGGAGEAAEPWAEQVRLEADLCRQALALLETCRDDPGAAGVETVLVLAVRWQTALRARCSVLGSRLAVSPDLGQRPDGTWAVRPTVVLEGRSATDALVRAALRAAGATAPGAQATG